MPILAMLPIGTSTLFCAVLQVIAWWPSVTVTTHCAYSEKYLKQTRPLCMSFTLIYAEILSPGLVISFITLKPMWWDAPAQVQWNWHQNTIQTTWLPVCRHCTIVTFLLTKKIRSGKWLFTTAILKRSLTQQTQRLLAIQSSKPL